MAPAICLVFFASGMAALVFETLWFRQVGLVLGNTVWASALVTASFMGGLAIGNGFAIRRGHALTRPLRVFAGLEIVVAITGSSLVFLLPVAERAAPGLAWASGAALDAARLVGAFVLLVVPASAMGTTLPVLARTLGARDPNFGRVLGRLYGWNTLGAMAGTLCAEALLVPTLGVRGTGLVAGALDLAAAAGAWLLDRRQAPLEATPRRSGALPPAASRIGLAAALAGALLLALEVVWFRFLLLFVAGTSSTFAVMLGVVLLGIAGGGLLGAAWLGRRPGDTRYAFVIALLAGTGTVATYAAFDPGRWGAPGRQMVEWHETAMACLALMLPVCVASGLLFTFLGNSLRGDTPEASEAAGLLTLSNTVGAMFGALVAGFVLVPLVGVERSLFGLAAGYGLVAAIAAPSAPGGRRGALLGGALFVAALVAFPFGSFAERHVRTVESYWRNSPGERVVAVEEGLTETVFLLRDDFLGQPLRWRLLTNGMSMSSTHYPSRRYMGFFVWWPVALHPAPRRALVISYGVGNTTRALAAIDEISRIDVVDVSAGVLRMSPRIWPDAQDDPLRDPRVHVNVEDGRFFLLAARGRYDIITGEPPPPKSAGIVNLYSREYFHLLRERLEEGGIVTYWLPVLHLAPREAQSIIRGFCDVFPDCSLWSGFGHEWMLAGSRGHRPPADESRFARLWRDPRNLSYLRAAGFESPVDLGTTFLADAPQLAALTQGAPPLVDEWPYRVDPRRQGIYGDDSYRRLMDVGGARARFTASHWVREWWPAAWRARTIEGFPRQELVNWLSWGAEGLAPEGGLATQHLALATAGPALGLWSLGTSMEEAGLAERLAAAGVDRPEVSEVLGLAAMAGRRYAEADALLARVEPVAPHSAVIRQRRVLALTLGGDLENARRLYQGAADYRSAPGSSGEARDWAWLAELLRTADQN
jgi:predicted membrane-bound spermidine synthase